MIINNTLEYAKQLVDVPYRWYKSNELFTKCDKFWAENPNEFNIKNILPETIRESDKCIVCTGLINLMRRYNNLSIPGCIPINNLEVSIDTYNIYKDYPGGTGAWFYYLSNTNRLSLLDINKKYPIGTLLLAPYVDDENDQGHVAVFIDDDKNIIHSYPTISYSESYNHKNHGSVQIEPFINSHYWIETGYYRYVCYPEDWLLCD